MPDGILPIILAIVTGGVGGKLLDHWFNRRTHNTDYWHREVERLREDAHQNNLAIASLREDVERYREESVRWRSRYYDERSEHERTRHQFGMTLLSLKEKGEITIQDIEDVYNGVVIPREQGSILTSTD